MYCPRLCFTRARNGESFCFSHLGGMYGCVCLKKSEENGSGKIVKMREWKDEDEGERNGISVRLDE